MELGESVQILYFVDETPPCPGECVATIGNSLCRVPSIPNYYRYHWNCLDTALLEPHG